MKKYYVILFLDFYLSNLRNKYNWCHGPTNVIDISDINFYSMFNKSK